MLCPRATRIFYLSNVAIANSLILDIEHREVVKYRIWKLKRSLEVRVLKFIKCKALIYIFIKIRKKEDETNLLN